MSSRTTIEIKLKYLQVMVKKYLKDVSIGSLDQLTKEMNSSMNSVDDVILNLIKAMLAFSMMQRQLNKSFDNVFMEILSKAKEVDEKVLFLRLKELFLSSFPSQFKMLQEQLKRMEGQKRSQKRTDQSILPRTIYSTNFIDPDEQPNIQFNPITTIKQHIKNQIAQHLEQAIKKSTTLPHLAQKTKPSPIQSTKFEPQNSQTRYSLLKQQATIEKKQDRDSQLIANLIGKNTCICEKIVVEKKTAFECPKCQSLFHEFCIGYPKPNQLPICPVCILENISPINPVQQTIFIGHLNENKLVHKIRFKVQDLQYLANPSKFKVQLRSLKLSQKSINQIQFPDSASIELNEKSVYEFFALNKTSSAKFRKDLPLQLRNLTGGGKENILKIVQKDIVELQVEKKRFFPTRHLIGIFIVKRQTFQQTFQRIKTENILPYMQGKQWISQLFNRCQQLQDEGIKVEEIRVSLRCPLTKDIIETPVRGIYCSHIQCFDLMSYLTLMLSTKVPTWSCPICKTLAAELKFDEMMSLIIKKSLKRRTSADKEVDVVFTRDDRMFFAIKPKKHQTIQSSYEVEQQENNLNHRVKSQIEGSTLGTKKVKPTFYFLDEDPQEAKIQSPKLILDTKSAIQEQKTEVTY